MPADLTNTVPILSVADFVGDPEAQKRALAFAMGLGGEMDNRIVAEISQTDGVDPFATMHATMQVALSFAARAAAALIGAYEGAAGAVVTDGDEDMSPAGVEAFCVEQFELHFADAMEKQRASAVRSVQ